MAELLNDCFQHGKGRLSHAEALSLLQARIAPVAASETIELRLAAGRILAQAAVAPLAVPAHTNTAVDGYSFRADDYDPAIGGEFPVTARITAGHALAGAVVPGAAARIFTGASMPAGHDTVVMQEDVEIKSKEPQIIVLPRGIRRGADVRRAGEDVRAGEILLAQGSILRPQDVAGLASIGRLEVQCYARLRVAIVSTGDEVVRPGARLGEGKVYDANAPMLEALVAGAGALSTDLGILPDDLGEVTRRLASAAAGFDVIISSGGASRGEEDHIVAALDRLGKRHMWQLAIKPGRPMSFGQIGNCVVVGLPGNPVAVFVCFLLYVYP